jgi:hypothetical protein
MRRRGGLETIGCVGDWQVPNRESRVGFMPGTEDAS